MVQSQRILKADGPGNTYELINQTLANNSVSVEAPDQCTNHSSFGRHIREVWDSSLNSFVFEFIIHANPDNDRCIMSDRQRVEIKTYEPSPDYLKGIIGEIITYKWKFRLPDDFYPSTHFTHIHQIKAVGGDSGSPLFTVSPRYNKEGNTLQIIYTANQYSKPEVLIEEPLHDFLGKWVEAEEIINIGKKGKYTIHIKNIKTNEIILSYTNNKIATIRKDNKFIRPKWGVYRSLASPQYLKDEMIRMNDFSIIESAHE
jgi:hypothetical protein